MWNAEVTKIRKADRSAFELQVSHMVRALLSFMVPGFQKPVSKEFSWAGHAVLLCRYYATDDLVE